MRPSLRHLVLGGMLVLTTANRAALADPYRMLERITNAAQKLNYVGEFAYVRGTGLQNMRVVHSFDAQGEHERLSALDGPAREYVRDGGVTRWMLPGNMRIGVRRNISNSNFLLVLPRRLQELQSIYRVSDAGSGRVAGRLAYVLDVIPTDEYRFGFRLWADQEKGLLLKALLRSKLETIEQFSFTHVRFPETIPVSMWRPENLSDDRVWVSEPVLTATSDVAASSWTVAGLPVGFVQQGYVREQLAGGGSIEHLVFTDGIASVSVFVEPLTNGVSFTGKSQLAGVGVHGVVTDRHQITVMGEVPQRTLEKIAGSLQFVGDAVAKHR